MKLFLLSVFVVGGLVTSRRIAATKSRKTIEAELC